MAKEPVNRKSSGGGRGASGVGGRSPTPLPKWSGSIGNYIFVDAHVTQADLEARRVEKRWGIGRARLLVSPELRDKFDRQRLLFNNALYTGDQDDVARESARMLSAWKAVDKAAESAGFRARPPEILEHVLPDGRVLWVVGDNFDMQDAEELRAGRAIVIMSCEEVGNLLTALGAVGDMKVTFGGFPVTYRGPMGDPLDGIATGSRLDDPIPFPFPREPSKVPEGSMTLAVEEEEDDEWA